MLPTLWRRPCRLRVEMHEEAPCAPNNLLLSNAVEANQPTSTGQAHVPVIQPREGPKRSRSRMSNIRGLTAPQRYRNGKPFCAYITVTVWQYHIEGS